MDEVPTLNETLAEPIKVRLTVRQRFRCEQAAAHEGLTLSAYIRKQLFIAGKVDEELKALRALIVDLEGKEEQKRLIASSIESTLILRSLIEPGSLRSIHSVVKSMGINPISAT